MSAPPPNPPTYPSSERCECGHIYSRHRYDRWVVIGDEDRWFSGLACRAWYCRCLEFMVRTTPMITYPTPPSRYSSGLPRLAYLWRIGERDA